MPDPIVDAALARGALIVTPNKRLAREIAFRHDRAQAAAGRSTWPAARILPWTAFVDGMVRSALDAGLPVPPQRLSPEQSAQLWQRVVRRNLDAPLLDLDAVSVLAGQTWELVHAYGGSGESWRGLDGRGPDTDAFVDWARRYERETARLDAIDAARAADVVAASAAALPEIAALDVVFVGFVELSPQERRLIDALRAAGASVEQQDTDSGAPIASTARLVEVTTPRDELIAALDWARERVSRDASAQVGIVVPDLAQRRNQVRALADDRLCPALAVPGGENAARPYDISLGVPLADVPLVSCALDLIALGEHPIERVRATVLLRSAYLPVADSRWAVRASLERRWLDHSVNALTFDDVLIALERSDSALASRWRHLQRATRWPARAPPRAWVEHWRSWLQGAGWIEDRTLDTAEYQAQGAWNDLLLRFAGLSLVTPELTREDASATLLRLARAQIHQPEARGARIRILGMLEAAGLAFDGLWVTGMTADAWPGAPAPNPLLPIRWQRERGVPRSSAAQELDFAHRHTALLSRAAPEVVFSFASRLDEHVRAPSPLVAALPRIAVASAPLTAERLFLERPPLERIEDRLAPIVAAGSSVSGGAGVIETQSGCPFRAMARYRLRAEEWPTVTLGIGPRERGTLVHAALAAFWSEVRDQAGLLALSAEGLDARIAGAVEKSRTAIDDAHWNAIPAAVAMSEATCLRQVLREWLELERERASFSVLETEAKARLEIAGFTLDMRLDRVDALAAGGVAIVDYKSGRTSPVAKWFDERPQGIQLAAYATAYAQRAPAQPVRALVYGKLRRAEVGPVGLADDETLWRDVSTPAQVKPSGAAPEDWDSALRSLDARMTTLAQSFAAGDASVTPRDRKLCANCHLHALCRIGATPVDDDEERFETGDDA